ncbi:hypothetical protein HC956_05085 [Alcaligenes faecalis]|uniref:Uncharacterized protein n=1 Tax=Alcaligenes ammonioxydans TaxID=2582914 RepID=A0ABX8SQZ9_9BURK|nr:hypothetical protein [Alcaligenes ammonioxydans]QXX78451.1 hypothetical protein FE795_05085 [Alcaligenes ammonioxydans]
MARYIAKQRGQIPADAYKPVKRADSSPNRRVMRIVEAGEEFEFHGKPGKWMELVSNKKESTAKSKGDQGNETSPKSGGKPENSQTNQDESQSTQGDNGTAAPNSQ